MTHTSHRCYQFPPGKIHNRLLEYVGTLSPVNPPQQHFLGMGLTTHEKGHLCSGRSSGWLDFGKEMEIVVLHGRAWNGALGMAVGCRLGCCQPENKAQEDAIHL